MQKALYKKNFSQFLMIFCFSFFCAEQGKANESLDALSAKVQKYIKSAGVSEKDLSLYITTLVGDHPSVVLDTNAKKKMIPASVTKVVTASAVLEAYPPGHKFKTQLLRNSENKVSEYFEDNNFFTKSVYLQSDLIPPAVKITFDENEVVDGDFVSKNPNIKIALSEESPIPIVDTSAVKIYLNEEPVYYGANPSILSYTINSINPKFVVDYKPELDDGEYLLRVVAKDPNGNLADSASSEVYFVVSSETKLHQVYNYPNPFANETYFTFRLSQIPEEVKIRIYTIAGRMIKEIIKKSSELNYDLNKIYWDGRDEDGDVIANGTYLYKLLMKNDDKIESVIQKLVIVK